MSSIFARIPCKIMALVAPWLVQCMEPPMQKVGDNASSLSQPAGGTPSQLTDTLPITTLRADACAAIKTHLGDRIPDLSQNFCNEKLLDNITLKDVATKENAAKPIMALEEKSPDGVSHLGYASPIYIGIQPVDFFEFIVAGVMKKGVGGKSIDESIKVYDFKPVPSTEEFGVSTYEYKLDFSRNFGDIELKTTSLGMQMEKIYLPDEKIFVVAERSTGTIQDGLFKKWGLYIVFQAKGDQTIMWTYLDMKIANLGIHELIKDQFMILAERIPGTFFENVSRVFGN